MGNFMGFFVRYSIDENPIWKCLHLSNKKKNLTHFKFY